MAPSDDEKRNAVEKAQADAPSDEKARITDYDNRMFNYPHEMTESEKVAREAAIEAGQREV